MVEQTTKPKSKAAYPAGRTSFAKRARRLRPVWRKRSTVAFLAASDASLALVIWGATRLLSEFRGVSEGAFGINMAAYFPSVAVWLALRALLGLYPGYGLDAVERLKRHTYSVLASLAVLAVFAFGFHLETILSRLIIGVSFLCLLVAAPVMRQSVTAVLHRVGLWGVPVLVLSYKDTGAKFTELLRAQWGLGYRPVGLFDYNLLPAGEAFKDVPYQKTLSDATKFAREQDIDTVIFATPNTRREQLAHMVNLASESFRYVLIVPNLTGVTNSAVIARDLGGTFAVEIKHNLLDPWSRRLKRAIDLFVVTVGGALISPLLLLITLAVKLDSPGPVFFGHRRLGAGSEHFSCLKFRTMYARSDTLLEEYLQKNPDLREEWEQTYKLRFDPRVTRVGRILRKTSLDELPQLLNVLRGEMSLVGPRPIVDAEVARYREGYDLYRRIRPGMSGLWQVSGRSDTDYAERVEIDSYYVRNWSVWLDIVILARTVRIVLRGRGAY